MTNVVIDPRLVQESEFLCDLKLCRVYLKKDSEVPWIVLVPRKENCTELTDLNEKERYLLMDEIQKCCLALEEHFEFQKLNVATLGNIVSQLHVHVIGRLQTDRAWPNPIWGTSAKGDWISSEIYKQYEALKLYLIG